MTPDTVQAKITLAQGWPRSAIQGSADYIALWHQHFGAGLRRVVLDSGMARLELVSSLARRRLALGSRFEFCPADPPFVRHPERRLLPLRQLSAPASLEAGNLRGGLQLAPGTPLAGAIGDLVATLSRRRGWDYLTLPVPASEARLWTAAAAELGLPTLVRATGRVFHANMSARTGWDGHMAQASRNDRKNESRALRRAEEAGLSLWSGPATAADFAALRKVADISNKAMRRQSAAVFVPYTLRQEAFLRAACSLPGNHGLMVRLDGPQGPLAAALWLRRGADLLGTVTFHTEDSRPFSPGLLLAREAFVWARAHGIERMDFNATDPLYANYSDQTQAFHDLLLFPPNMMGRLLQRLAAARGPGLAEGA